MKNGLKTRALIFLALLVAGNVLLIPPARAWNFSDFPFEWIFEPESVTTISNEIDLEDSTAAVVSVNAYKEVRRYVLQRNRSIRSADPIELERGFVKLQISSGSGFFITSDGYLLTNKHVVSDPSAEYTINFDGDSEIPAEVVYRDPDNDLALVKVQGENYPIMNLGDSSTLKTGENVVGIGNALGLFTDSISSGEISDLNENITVSDENGIVDRFYGMIESTAKLYPGDSGGPLLNAAGEVIGINTATRIGQKSSAGYSIPINEAKMAIYKAGLEYLLN